ncbi:MAG TPA: vWA domain-containing protein, partial [Planctomycetota bacterium]|nr:vWA domain-containing protein [Planctomycetota bacterium]
VCGIALLAAAIGGALSRGQDLPPGGGSTPTEGSTGTSTRGTIPGGAPEVMNYKDKIVFVLDRSGSMALADRFATALDAIDEILHEMPKDLKFDIYLTTETTHSLFKNEWYRPTIDIRKTIRSKIAEAGGLDYGGFTDIAGAVKHIIDKRRPEAVYLLSDGVATINELDTEKIVGSIAKVALGQKVPVHTIAIGVGQDVAEDGVQALAVMKGLAEATGGVYRELKSELRPKGRAFLLWPPWAPLPADELARIHLKDGKNKEVRQRVFGGRGGLPEVYAEIEDPALTAGSIAFEYAAPQLIVRTYLPNGRPFFESRPIGMRRAVDRFTSSVMMKIVSPMDDSGPDEVTAAGVMPIKCPVGGSVDFVYKRGAREFRETCLMQDVGSGK